MGRLGLRALPGFHSAMGSGVDESGPLDTPQQGIDDDGAVLSLVDPEELGDERETRNDRKEEKVLRGD